jgi:hypothetical protein
MNRVQPFEIQSQICGAPKSIPMTHGLNHHNLLIFIVAASLAATRARAGAWLRRLWTVDA